MHSDVNPGKQDANRIYDLAIVLVSLGVFLVLTLYQIDLPGLHTDEAMEVLVM